jgi:outer membrane protein
MKTKQLIIYSAIVIAVSALSVVTYHYCYSGKTAYIDIKKVFNEFALKKELEDKYAITAKHRAAILDSLSTNLKLLSAGARAERKNEELIMQFERKREEFLKARDRFDEDNAALSRKYDAQILEQMTQYVSDFGKKHGYKYIFGAEGNGTLMYAETTENISEEIIRFINNKYKGID